MLFSVLFLLFFFKSNDWFCVSIFLYSFFFKHTNMQKKTKLEGEKSKQRNTHTHTQEKSIVDFNFDWHERLNPDFLRNLLYFKNILVRHTQCVAIFSFFVFVVKSTTNKQKKRKPKDACCLCCLLFCFIIFNSKSLLYLYVCSFTIWNLELSCNF